MTLTGAEGHFCHFKLL